MSKGSAVGIRTAAFIGAHRARRAGADVAVLDRRRDTLLLGDMNDARRPVVFVIDDEEDVRASIAGLLKSAGLRSETFGSAQEFLRRPPPDGPACLVLDVKLPGMSGLDVQRQLAD